MNITSSRVNMPARVNSSSVPTFSQDECRKLAENDSWKVGGQTFDSTTDLVEQLRSLDKPTEGTYRVKPSALARLGQWAGATAIGGAVVGGIGAAIGVAGSALFEVAGTVAPFFGVMVNGNAGPILGPAIGLGVLGAVGTGILAAVFDRLEYGAVENVKGTLQSQEAPEGDALVFRPKGSHKAVDLQLFSQAEKEYAFYDDNQWWQ
jgi:hypothetical protein